jgi:hypothetical protein
MFVSSVHILIDKQGDKVELIKASETQVKRQNSQNDFIPVNKS